MKPKEKNLQPEAKQADKPLSVNALAETLRKDRRTIKRAIAEAGLVPVCHEAGQPRYAQAQAEEAVEDYLVSNLPSWNPSPEEAAERLASLAEKLVEMLQRSNVKINLE